MPLPVLQPLSEEDSLALSALPEKQRNRVLAWMDALAPAVDSPRKCHVHTEASRGWRVVPPV